MQLAEALGGVGGRPSAYKMLLLTDPNGETLYAEVPKDRARQRARRGVTLFFSGRRTRLSIAS